MPEFEIRRGRIFTWTSNGRVEQDDSLVADVFNVQIVFWDGGVAVVTDGDTVEELVLVELEHL